MAFERAVQNVAATWGYRRMGETFICSISDIARGVINMISAFAGFE
jgi:hypothetical protein